MDKAEKIKNAINPIMDIIDSAAKKGSHPEYTKSLVESYLSLLYEEGKTAGIMVMLGKKDLNEANH